MLNITDIRVILIEGESKVKALASITIDECFVIHDIRVVEGERGLFVAMPSRQSKSGDFKDIAHPINIETRNQIENLILKKYKTL